ncbi:PREDICTED: excitatory amino acid transporter isoform X2 [Nicrophorus vespilloides]|uniref:Amino acid transporter n=1 Tax=Nicrophorus vespilloides TaxID=110193 RepID=A0ABM1MLE4_NICVS|nr:PREDICTED: excitatory amino acid transporter isoform X2 [Nicrophorus vespilloides]
MEDTSRFSEYLFAKMPEENTVKIECTEHSDKKEMTGAKKWMSENLLLLGTLLGVAIGAIIGFGLRPCNLSQSSIMLISYPGELFMRLLKLIILPLIISSLVAGSASLNAKLNGRIAVRTLIYFLITSIINAILGVVLVTIIHPGHPGLKETLGDGTENRGATSMLDSLLDLGRNIVADNIFQATFQQAHTAYINTSVVTFNAENGTFDSSELTERQINYRAGTNTLGIVFFCLIFGTILGTLGEKSKVVIEFFTVTFEVVMKFVTGVMWLTPFGISSVIAGKILSVNDLALVISNLACFIATVVLGVFIYQLIIMQLIYLLFLRKNPFKFYAGLIQSTCTAFATASTAAALPITFRLMNDKLKIDTRITRFVLPIGCNINMDGTALFVAIASVFIAQMNGIELGFGELVTVCFTSTAASFSSASVPSAALVLLLMVLSAIDTPVQDVSLLFAVDWIVDRFRTTNNMLGDCYAAAVVELLSKKELMAADAILQESSLDYEDGNSLRNSISKDLGPSEIVIRDDKRNGTNNI